MKQRMVTASVAGAALATGGVMLGRTARRTFAGDSSTKVIPYKRGARIEEYVTIARPPADVYAAWRDLESLPLVMPNVQRVESTNGQARSRWTVRGPGGKSISWEAEIFEDVPNQRIAWRADRAPVKHAGTVRFMPAPGGRGTELRVEIEYLPPGGLLGVFGVKAARASSQHFVALDLRRFKSVMEAGGVALNGTDVTQ
jgi:uncharacterized membrane protein